MQNILIHAYFSYEISPKFEYRLQFRNFAIRMKTSGIENYYIHVSSSKAAEKASKPFVPVQLEHVYIIFSGFFAIFLLSIIILIFEIIFKFHVSKSYRNNWNY